MFIYCSVRFTFNFVKNFHIFLNKMFSDFDSEVSSFESGSELKRLQVNQSCQTDDLKTSNQKSQTASAVSCGSQTALEDTLKVNDDVVGDHAYDADKLLKFLNRVIPHLNEELKSCDSNSDLNFILNDFGYLNIEEEEKFEQHQQTLLKPDFCKDKVVSSLSWNSSNVMLAVAYKEKNHKGWCYHESTVGLYNVEKPQFEKNKPVQLLKVSGCVMCIEFHNRIPSLLAAALYNGDVIVWDLKHDEGILIINKKGSGDEAAHIDVITFLTWREDENGSWLVSAGRDGRIILWKVAVTNLTYEVHQRFLILKQHLSATAAPSEHLEIIHMDFQSSKGPCFVVACDGGSVFYCSLTTARPLTSFAMYKDPVMHSFKPRKGIVTYVSCSADLFASSGTDSEIHIYKYKQESPILKIYTNSAVFGAQWNSPEELVSWNDSTLECYKIHDFGGKNMICKLEGGISTVAFKISSDAYGLHDALLTKQSQLRTKLITEFVIPKNKSTETQFMARRCADVQSSSKLFNLHVHVQ